VRCGPDERGTSALGWLAGFPSSFHNRNMSEASDSSTPLRATFKISLDGNTVSIATVGEAYHFITNSSSVEWMELRSLHQDALSSLHGAAGNAMLTVQATNALRALFGRARLL
jgi:hypothetical protein